MQTLITTTINPSQAASLLCKTLSKIIPESVYVKRGRKSLNSIADYANTNNYTKILIISSKEGSVNTIEAYYLENGIFQNFAYYLKISNYIDYKIFGFDRIPANGPLSCPVHITHSHELLFDFFEKFFGLVYNKKTQLWLLVDNYGENYYIQIVDQLYMKKITYMQIQLKKHRE